MKLLFILFEIQVEREFWDGMGNEKSDGQQKREEKLFILSQSGEIVLYLCRVKRRKNVSDKCGEKEDVR